jgi:DNA-binding SARP family transcriptional activator
VQIAQGNAAAAIRGYHEYRALLRDEFGIEPSRAIRDMLAPLILVTLP